MSDRFVLVPKGATAREPRPRRGRVRARARDRQLPERGGGAPPAAPLDRVPGLGCMSCEHELAWYDNIPLVSYAGAARPLPPLQGARSRGATRPSRALTALLVAGCASRVRPHLGLRRSPPSSAPRSSRSRPPTSSAGSSRTASCCPAAVVVLVGEHGRCIRRSSGRRRGPRRGGFLLLAALAYPAGMGMGDVKLALLLGARSAGPFRSR